MWPTVCVCGRSFLLCVLLVPVSLCPHPANPLTAGGQQTYEGRCMSEALLSRASPGNAGAQGHIFIIIIIIIIIIIT